MQFKEQDLNGLDLSYLNNDVNEKKYSEDKSRVVYVLVQKDGDVTYLDASTITALMCMDKINTYTYPDGSVYIVTDSTVVNKGVPSGHVSFRDKNFDFSSILPYNDELGLYEVTEEQIDMLYHFDNGQFKILISNQ